MKYKSEEDFLSKVDYEGGPEEAIVNYGIKSEDCPPGNIRQAFAVLEKIFNSIEYRNAKEIISNATMRIS